MVAPSWVLLLLMWLLYVSFGECYKQSRALFCFKSIQTCCLGMISWWNFPKSNFSICVKKLLCRMNSTCVSQYANSLQRMALQRVTSPASYLPSLLTSPPADGHSIAVEIPWYERVDEGHRLPLLDRKGCDSGMAMVQHLMGMDTSWMIFYMNIFSHVMPMRHDSHHSPIRLHLLDAWWYFEICLNTF